LMIISILMMSLSHCSSTKFDGFDPTTSALRWIMTGDKNE